MDTQSSHEKLLAAGNAASFIFMITMNALANALPINGMIEVARRRGLTPTLLDLRNSGDTAGDRARVVGYGSYALFEA